MSLDRVKLTKLLGMLGSAHDGEIAAAGRAVTRLMREAGVGWPEVLNGGSSGNRGELEAVVQHLRMQLVMTSTRAAAAEAGLRAAQAELQHLRLTQAAKQEKPQPIPRDGSAYAPVEDERSDASMRRTARAMLASRWSKLNDFEKEFLHSISNRRGDYTDKQRAVFKRILQKFM